MNRAPKAKCDSAFVGQPIHASTSKTTATAQAGGEKREFYKPLPKQFRRDEFDFRQIAREKNAAIYQQHWIGCAEPSVCYEVIRIRRRDGFTIGGRFVEPAEVYPNSEAWGVDGWTVQGKEAAFHKLQETIRARKKESANPVKKSPIQNSKCCPEVLKLRAASTSIAMHNKEKGYFQFSLCLVASAKFPKKENRANNPFNNTQ